MGSEAAVAKWEPLGLIEPAAEAGAWSLLIDETGLVLRTFGPSD